MPLLSNCPFCGAPLPRHTAGQAVNCPYCGSYLSAEALGEKPDPAPEPEVIFNPPPTEQDFYRPDAAQFERMVFPMAGRVARGFIPAGRLRRFRRRLSAGIFLFIILMIFLSVACLSLFTHHIGG